MPLRSNLRGKLVLLGEPLGTNHTGLLDGIGQWLFAIHVHVTVQSPIGDEGMRVIGRAADDGIDVFLFQAFAPVEVVLRSGEYLGRLGQVLLVDVAQRNDILVS